MHAEEAIERPGNMYLLYGLIKKSSTQRTSVFLTFAVMPRCEISPDHEQGTNDRCMRYGNTEQNTDDKPRWNSSPD